MRIKQLGNGGAFDFEQTNSSFLFEIDNNYLLFDCGYSVFAELRKRDTAGKIDLKKLKYIFISHMDDDHIGSLKTLIYYMYFVLETELIIIAGKNFRDNVYGELKTYLNPVLNDHKGRSMCSLVPISLHQEELKNVYIEGGVTLNITATDHHVPCFGLLLSTTEGKILISGDTKYHSNINYLLEQPELKVCYHDYTNYASEDSVHCCALDYDKYSDIAKSKIIKYHTGDAFNGRWFSLDEKINILKFCGGSK